MTEKKLLTVCTAAYNAELYIGRMLDSILLCDNKSLIEIIVVNDGSTDATKSIVEEYTLKYPDIVRLINKSNGGSGSARNVAFKKAKGKYLKIIDADDFVKTNELEKFVKELAFVDADVIWNGFIKRNGYSGYDEFDDFASKYMNENEIVELETFGLKIPDHYVMHGITYRTAIIQEHKLFLSEGTPYVDLEYQILPVPYINTVAYINHHFYFYNYGLEGQSMDPQVVVKKEEKIKDLVKSILDYKQRFNNLSVTQMKMMNIMAAQACVMHYIVYYNQENFKLKNRLVEIDKYYKDYDEEVWHMIPKSSEYAKLFRMFDYLGYYPMIIAHKIRRRLGKV